MAAVKKSVSVKDVARLAGVSEQTVSRTVHDSPSVRLETKERVRAAMRELGYRPNFAGRSLRRGKFKTVGVAMFNITGTGNLDRMEGFAAAADKHGYAITLTKVDGHPYTLEGASSRIRNNIYNKNKNYGLGVGEHHVVLALEGLGKMRLDATGEGALDVGVGGVQPRSR